MGHQCPPNTGLGASKLEGDESRQRGESLTNTQSSLAGFNGNIWKWSMRVRGKDPTSVSMAPCPEVVGVSTVCGFQSSAVTCSAPRAVAHTSGSSQPALSSPSRTLSSQLDRCQRGSAHDLLSARKNKGKQRDDPPPDAQSPPSHDRTLLGHLDSKDSRGSWERLMQARGKNSTFGSLYSSTRLANAPQRRIPRNPWHWNSSLCPGRSSRHLVDITACRDEDRYAITPESDAEAAAAMLRTNDDMADSSTRPGQPAVAVQVSQGRPTQTQVSTAEHEEIIVRCCGFFIGYVH
ncbi:uncharacterized protein BJ212DRAFT_104056 [Suillus subaureus]|uniref:Uncharacterized protein n=1 Tax=Suillus subaureus TaxID=48587 RepID=A0A9P7EDQ7_9AGAM|nr:uncharacterized protein BJ212DRAFT_104056 [Suillus subaureus]KAG1818693.1 hypothetical protein BJ212DRAFT_104056 [Suillus subaureus]